MIPLPRAARRAVFVASAALGLTGLLAGSVRVLPWLLDPSVPWSVAAPFARGLVAVALESALLAGWPVGWSFACFRFVESGEARVLQSLGERPWKTVARLKGQGVLLAAALASVAVVYGREASAPGRVATDLIARAAVSCGRARSHITVSVPFTDFTWLCVPGKPPRLAGSLPTMPSVFVSARDARIAGDFRAVELDDARIAVAGTSPAALHVGFVSIRGLAPWAHASGLPPGVRALVLALSGVAASTLSSGWILLRPPRTRMGVLSLGAAGPLAALALLRVLERASATPGAFVVVPLAAGACPALLAYGLALIHRLRRLQERGRAATTTPRV